MEIRYQLSEPTRVSVRVYDALGVEVMRLAEGVQEAGVHTATWSGTTQQGAATPAGMYIVQVRLGLKSKAVKVMKD